MTPSPFAQALEAHGWTAYDKAQYFEPLAQHTVGMSHPERVAWLANELSLHGDDEHLTKSKDVAWAIIVAWEAARDARPVFTPGGVEKMIADLNRIAADSLFSDRATDLALERL